MKRVSGWYWVETEEAPGEWEVCWYDGARGPSDIARWGDRIVEPAPPDRDRELRASAERKCEEMRGRWLEALRRSDARRMEIQTAVLALYDRCPCDADDPAWTELFRAIQLDKPR